MHRTPSALPAAFVPAREAYGDDGPRWVVGRAEAEIVRRDGELDDGELGLTAAMFDPPRGAFVMAHRGHAAGPPIGGLGVRTVDHHFAEGARRGEIRRLWVDPAWRGHAVARRLMDAVEQEARQLGLDALRLITGARQAEAQALYASSGWDPDPANSAATGFRYSKRLDVVA